jgi:hypothetical protein
VNPIRTWIRKQGLDSLFLVFSVCNGRLQIARNIENCRDDQLDYFNDLASFRPYDADANLKAGQMVVERGLRRSGGRYSTQGEADLTRARQYLNAAIADGPSGISTRARALLKSLPAH